MKLLCLGHSLIADRQRIFYEHVRSLGHEVKLLTLDFGSRVRNLQGIVNDYKPDLIRVEDEKDGITIQVPQLRTDARRVLFSGENMQHMQNTPDRVLKEYDLIIPGCPGALRLLTSRNLGNVYDEFIPQVGVDDELFKPLNTQREFDTCTSSGFTVNKGVGEIEEIVRKLGLRHLWLGKKRKSDVTPYKGFPSYGKWPKYRPYDELPKWYNRARVHVLASRDTPMWIEQFTYALAESLACGLRQVITDAGDWPEIWGDAPGVEMIAQGHESEFARAIMTQLDQEELNSEGRDWARERYGKRAVAKQLLRVLENA